MLRSVSVLLLLAAACDPKPTDEVIYPDETDIQLDTDHADTDHTPELPQDTTNFRPLCLEQASKPAIAQDLIAWNQMMVNTTNKFYGELEWRGLEAAGENLGGTAERVTMNHILRGWHRLKFNDLTGAIEDFEAALALAEAEVPRWQGRARELLGVAWMRKAETDNCITNPTGHACIIPFDAEGMHADPIGMANAEGALHACLVEDDPEALSPKWLYNVTFMARGTWPEDVDARFAFPEGFLDTEAPIEGWFNHLPSLGITDADIAGGATLQDFDGDGLLDIMFSTMLLEGTMRLYLNTGDGKFCDASNASGVSAIPSLLAFSVADYDNDGDIDVAGPRGAWMATEGTVRPSLLQNDGQGHFVDVAVQAGIADPRVNGPTQVSAWADVDNDGLLDLFIGREDDEGSVTNRRVSSLYHNQGDGRFVDIASDAGISSAGFVKGASFLDFDRDGWMDLYVSSLKGPDRLFRNRGDLTFNDVAADLGVEEPFKSFASGALDYDQDGLIDIISCAFTNNYAGGGPLDPSYFQSAESYLADKLGIEANPLFSETAHLYRNTGTAFEDVTVEVGLDDIHATMGFSFGDFNMDGYPDLYMATGAPEYDALEPNVAYLNQAGAAFADVTTAMRTGHIQKGHGVSFGDLDEDGDQDLLVSAGGAFRGDPSPDLLFANPTNTASATTHHFVTLRLEGVTSNRSAIGARVEVVTPGRTFWQMVGETGSFGANSLQLEVGLADQDTITEVRIQWPGGDLEVLTEVPVDQIVSIRQGEGVVSTVAPRRLTLHKINHGG
jgi:hypothetical protein